MACPESQRGYYTVGHWFDGFTTTHKFDIHPNSSGRCDRISYSSFMQVENLMSTVKNTGGVGGNITFGQRDPCNSLFRKVKSVFSPQGSGDPLFSNVGVVLRKTLPVEAASIHEQKRANRRLITISTDNIRAKHIDADTLEPLSVTTQADIDSSLSGQMSAAHVSEAHRDLVSTEVTPGVAGISRSRYGRYFQLQSSLWPKPLLQVRVMTNVQVGKDG